MLNHFPMLPRVSFGPLITDEAQGLGDPLLAMGSAHAQVAGYPGDLYIHDRSSGSMGGGGPPINRIRHVRDFFWGKPQKIEPMPPEHRAAFDYALQQTGQVPSIIIKEDKVKIGCHRARGFWIEPQEDSFVRIARPVGHENQFISLKMGERSFLREGDILQISKRPPFLFKDSFLPPFRSGHRYPEDKPPQILMNVVSNVLNYTSERTQTLGIKVSCHESLGVNLQPISEDKPITVYSNEGETVETLVASHPRAVFLREGDVVQIGDMVPFVVPMPLQILFPLTSFRGGKNVVLKKTPKSFVEMVARAVCSPGQWISGGTEDVPIQVFYNEIYSTLGIVYKAGLMQEEILVVGENRQVTVGYGGVSIDVARDKILQFGDGTPFEFRMPDIEARIRELSREQEKVREEARLREVEAELKREKERRRSRDQAQREQAARERAREEARQRVEAERKAQEKQATKLEKAMAILDLSRDLIRTERDVKNAYRKLAVKWHPDKHRNDPEASKKFKTLMRAYQFICRELGFEPTIQ